jgi:hypothetical protein
MLKTTVLTLAAVLAATPALAANTIQAGTPEQEAAWRVKCVDEVRQHFGVTNVDNNTLTQFQFNACMKSERIFEQVKKEQRQAEQDHRRLVVGENQKKAAELLQQAERDRQAAETARQSAERLRQATEAARAAAEQKAEQERQAAAAQAAQRAERDRQAAETARQAAAAQMAQQAERDRQVRFQRRQFITLLGGAAATWPLAARGQRSALPVVAYVDGGSADTSAGLCGRIP